MPDMFVYHKWVEIPPQQQGSFLIKCHQCERHSIRNIIAREMCDGCFKVLCSHSCFENCHGSDGSDGYILVPFLTSGRRILPKILRSRELGGISRGRLTEHITIEYVVCDHQIMRILSTDPDTDTDHRINESSSSSDTDTDTV